MARLPIIGADTNNWGSILVPWLQVGHNADGTHPFTVCAQPTGVAATDTTNITASLAGGGWVLLQPGTYLVNSLSNVLVSNTHWQGCGRGVTTVKYAPSQAGHMLAQTTAISNVTIEGITFDYNGTNGTGSIVPDDDAILLQNITNLKLADNDFNNGRVGCMVGLLACTNVLVLANWFANQGYGGHNCDHFFAGSGCDRLQVTNNHLMTCTDSGIVSNQNHQTVITGNNLFDIGVNGIAVTPTTVDNGVSATIVGNTIYGPAVANDISIGILLSGYDPTFGNAVYCQAKGNIIASFAQAIHLERGAWLSVCENTLFAGVSASISTAAVTLSSTAGSLSDVQINGNLIDGHHFGINFAQATGITSIDVFNNAITTFTTAVGGTLPADYHHANNRGIDY